MTFQTPDEAVDEMAFSDDAVNVIGTPDDLVAKIKEMTKLSGGFGTVIGFVHDWANREDTKRSWDLVARYVIPEVNGLLHDYRESNEFVIKNRETWNRAGQAIMSKIQENKRAAEAMKEESDGQNALGAHSAKSTDDASKQAEDYYIPRGSSPRKYWPTVS